ncbi:MAG: flavodoxin family protein [Eubacteriales bacterium]|nr:flavodoxin family protein [Eubacteriales bacterium]
MHVLGICGSPRPGGNAQLLLDAALAPLREAGWRATEFLLSEKTVLPCTGCERCIPGGVCALHDDMAQLYEAYAACDAVIIAAPVYWRTVPAQLKAVMDRTFAVQRRRPLRGKLGGALCVGRGTGGGQAITLNTIYTFYLSCGMLCVPGELNGVTAVADAPGDIANQPDRLEQAACLGRNILAYAR